MLPCLRSAVLALTTVLALACASNDSRPMVVDGGTDSGNPMDAGGTDSGSMDDAGPVDAGMDGGPVCVDEDEDGYGTGCSLGPDCDDSANAVHPGGTEVCNGVDDDCDDSIDEELSAPSCALVEGMCVGATARCGGRDGWAACGVADYGDRYEVVESLCDGIDNDCDGTTDEGCVCTPTRTQPCGSDVGACAQGMQTCLASATWGACDEEVGPMGELCDGIDNDCDDATDEAGDLTAPDCARQDGVCAGSKRSCAGVDGWAACSGSASYGDDYQVVEDSCDALDNDCDGVTDEGCECVTGRTQPCGSDIGLCVAGTQTCIEGSWGTCAGEVESDDEVCDGADNDCDDEVDEGLVAPTCELQRGVCSGSSQSCGGESGWQTCGGTDSYGPRYEVDETTCDGVDNDCDGDVDEGCPCIVGRPQECGSSVGSCERGVQTCSAEGWGACEGGTDPVSETCDGFDNDCNSATDDNLMPPPCSLQFGVCAGATQECGGLDGWTECGGTESYGPRYVATEDGLSDESICDGLDNDCDGEIDENCASGPLVSVVEDAVLPTIYDQRIAFVGIVEGNWDVFVYDLRDDTLVRLTDTVEHEGQPDIYGDIVAYQRGRDAAARIVVYDLRDDTETVLTSARSEDPRVFRNYVVWSDARDGDYDVFGYDLMDGSETPIAATFDNEQAPDMRGNHVVYSSDESGAYRTRVVDVVTLTDTEVSTTSTRHQLAPRTDWSRFGWTDARSAAEPLSELSNWDVYGAELDTPTSEEAVVVAGGSQVLGDVDGLIYAWSDHRNGNWDVAVRGGGSELFLTSSDATQGEPSIHGNVVVWYDNRLGSFDIYGARVSPVVTPGAGDVVISEILADVPAGTDVNGDGDVDPSEDEFLELVNATNVTLDISECVLADGVRDRHTFAPGTTVPAGGALVVFGGGEPAASFAGVQVVTASGGLLGLNNGGDTITLSCDGTTLDSHTYGTEGDQDESLTRDPYITGAFVRHSTATDAAGTYSPGTLVTGFAY